MDLPLPTYRHPCDAAHLIEVISMFAEKIDDAIQALTAEHINFVGKKHLIQMIMFTADLFMCEESFRDVENYLGDGAEAILRDFGGQS